MSENTHTLSAADVADILSRTLALAIEAGLIVGVRNAPANDRRPVGLMIYVAGLSTAGDGTIAAVEATPAPQEEQATL